MKHFICRGGCNGESNDEGMCEADGCDSQWEMLEECDCEDGKHGMGVLVKDSNGAVLNDGDNVVLIKDLPLRGTSRVYKRGTKVTGIKLTDNPEEIDCKIEGSKIVLRVEYLKKV